MKKIKKVASKPQKVSTEFKLVRKRDGRIVPFDEGRIAAAIGKAMKVISEGSEKDAAQAAARVVTELHKKFPANYILGIEEIQDVVEATLIALDYAKTAKAYILYRKERATIREKEKEIPERVKHLVADSKKYFRNPLSEFIYYRSYSRWLPDENRRETWIETVDRYMNFMRENVGGKIEEADYAELREAILKQEVMPSMRLMWSAGGAAAATNVAGYNCSFIAPSKLEDFGEIMYLSMCGTGVGFSVEQQTVQQLPQIKRQTGARLPTHMVPDSKEGWADALVLGLKTWFDGKDIDFDYSELRPMGARLKTMGGKSSGPGPLRALLTFARQKILARQGRRLTPLDAHDIICKTGEVVVMGGVRRSALISISDLDDPEMRLAKSGQFYLTEGQRAMANNSVAYNEKPSCVEFMDEWITLAKNGTGERGIFNRGGLKSQLPARRWKVFEKDAATSGTNPCVTSDTWVMTGDGARQVSDLINKSFEAVVNGIAYQSSGFFETGRKAIFEVRTKRGFMFRATGNHKVLVAEHLSYKTQRNVWKEVRELNFGDRIVLNDQRGISWGGRGTESEGWLLGNLLGDGNIEKDGKVNLDYWGITQPVMMQYAVNLVHGTVGARSDMSGHVAKTGYARVGSTRLGELALSYGMKYGHKRVTSEIEATSAEFYQGFLRGWFDADGSVQGNQKKGVSVRLSSSSLANLQAAQRMLARLGIISTLYKERRKSGERVLPDGRGGERAYLCQADHELVISGANLLIFTERVNFYDPAKKLKLQELIGSYRRRLNRERFVASVASITPAGTEKVYDCQVPGINAFDGNNILLHNCGEIVLKSREFCNLSEVVSRPEDTKESLLRKIRLATILGTYQSSLTNFKYLSPEWKKNCEEERLLGVSITGQWDCPAVRDAKVLRKLKDEAIRVNKTYAKRMGINPSTAITCVKPSGTVSQLVDAASGLHPRHAKYYIRRVRISSTDALFKMLKDQKAPYLPEVGQSKDSATTYVLEFPVKAPENAVIRRDISALEQLEHWKMVKHNYTEHNPSVTISVGADEWLKVGNWLYENWDLLGGLSFLPRDEHVYALAPYEEIDEARYKEMMADFPAIDFSQILVYEKEDNTQGAKELACVSGVCEITS